MKTHRFSGYKNLLLFSQLGLSVVLPVFLCAAVGMLTEKYWHTPPAVTVVFLLIGLASGMISAWKLMEKMVRFSSEDDINKDVSKKGSADPCESEDEKNNQSEKGAGQ